MGTQYLFVPQWQDSGTSRRLYKGAIALKEYFVATGGSDLTEIPVDVSEKPVIERNVLGRAAIERQLRETANALRSAGPDKTVCIGGGCGVEVPIVSYLKGRYADLQLFWIDAHGDLNSPESSPSKRFHGMPLRYLTERQNDAIGEGVNLIEAKDVRLVGARELDPQETAYARDRGIETISTGRDYWVNLCAATKTRKRAYIHVDLDAIEPRDYKRVMCPAPRGIPIDELAETIEFIRGKMDVVGISLLENVATNGRTLKALERIVAHARSM